MAVTFQSTPPFDRAAAYLLTQEERREIEDGLAQNLVKGPVIKGSGGLRKARFKYRGKGSSGGLRVCYLLRTHIDTITLIFIYNKTDKDDLSQAEIKAFAEFIGEIKRADKKKAEKEQDSGR